MRQRQAAKIRFSRLDHSKKTLKRCTDARSKSHLRRERKARKKAARDRGQKVFLVLGSKRNGKSWTVR